MSLILLPLDQEQPMEPTAVELKAKRTLLPRVYFCYPVYAFLLLLTCSPGLLVFAPLLSCSSAFLLSFCLLFFINFPVPDPAPDCAPARDLTPGAPDPAQGSASASAPTPAAAQASAPAPAAPAPALCSVSCSCFHLMSFQIISETKYT